MLKRKEWVDATAYRISRQLPLNHRAHDDHNAKTAMEDRKLTDARRTGTGTYGRHGSQEWLSHPRRIDADDSIGRSHRHSWAEWSRKVDLYQRADRRGSSVGTRGCDPPGPHLRQLDVGSFRAEGTARHRDIGSPAAFRRRKPRRLDPWGAGRLVGVSGDSRRPPRR